MGGSWWWRWEMERRELGSRVRGEGGTDDDDDDRGGGRGNVAGACGVWWWWSGGFGENRGEEDEGVADGDGAVEREGEAEGIAGGVRRGGAGRGREVEDEDDDEKKEREVQQRKWRRREALGLWPAGGKSGGEGLVGDRSVEEKVGSG